MIRKGYFSLLKHKIVSKYNKDVIKTNELNLMARLLYEWHELFKEYLEYRPSIEKA